MNKKNLAVAVCSIIASFSAVFSQSNYSDNDLVWIENFNEGSTIDESIWNYEYHKPGWVNNELQSYGNSTENTYIKDGCLVIQPVRIKNKDGSYSYTSGRINTSGKKTFKYGRIEARIKFPKGQGFLPAFWMMPENESLYGNWPKCGEIDIAEVLGNKPESVYGTIHFGDPHAQVQGSFSLDKGDFNSDFHNFAVEWEPGEIRYYCDGNLYKTINDWFTKKIGFGEVTYPAPFDQEFYFILNVAVGGYWPGNPTEETDFGEKAQMQVDWIKVYQKRYYNENVKKPEPKAITANPDKTGNLVKSDSESWTFLTAGGGIGDLKVSDGMLTVKTSVPGNVEYGVQVVQPKIPMVKGKIYRYSFDAKADNTRSIITGITAPDASYSRFFGDVKILLTNELQHFEYTFYHLGAPDSNGRIEFNLGSQNSTETVYISNIRLEITGDVDYEKVNSGFLPDGNYIHNGEFQEGEDRLDFWEIINTNDAIISVTNNNGIRELKITNPKKSSVSYVVLKQKNIMLTEGKTYIINFSAYSTKNCRPEFKIGKTKYLPFLTNQNTEFEYIFKYESSTETGNDFLINAGCADTTIFIDNISIKENVCLLNGEFDNGMAGFEVYAHDSVVQSNTIFSERGNNKFEISIYDTGKMDWAIQLKQNNISLVKGKRYRISLYAKSDLDRTIMYALQRDGTKDDIWTPYSGVIKFNVSKNWQKFETSFIMKNPDDPNVIFSLSMGAVNNKQITTKHKIYVDSISVVQIN